MAERTPRDFKTGRYLLPFSPRENGVQHVPQNIERLFALFEGD